MPSLACDVSLRHFDSSSDTRRAQAASLHLHISSDSCSISARTAAMLIGALDAASAGAGATSVVAAGAAFDVGGLLPPQPASTTRSHTIFIAGASHADLCRAHPGRVQLARPVDGTRQLALVYICAYTIEVGFQWDPKKAQSNARKHRVAFSDAVGVFEDPDAVTIDDPHPNEQRFATMGIDFLGRVLIVCWTPRDEDIRIFSARQATARERANYRGE